MDLPLAFAVKSGFVTINPGHVQLLTIEGRSADTWQRLSQSQRRSVLIGVFEVKSLTVNAAKPRSYRRLAVFFCVSTKSGHD
jgi:hypothetical protein